MKPKKVLLIGERSLGPDGYAYADSFYDILKDLGHTVLSLDPTQNPWWLRGNRSFGLSGIEQKVFGHWVNGHVVQEAESFCPDVCFVLKGHVLYPRTLEILKNRLKIKLVLLYPDNPFMFANGNSHARVVECLPLYDVVLSWAQMLQPVFTSLGVAHSCYFPFGYDARFFTEKIEMSPAFDLCFVGTADDERAELLDQVVCKASELQIGIWGNRWSEYFQKKPSLASLYKGPAVYKHEMVKLLHQAKITLNPVRLQNHTSHNMRSLEAAAAGVFQLATRTHEHAHVLFKEDDSIVLYGSAQELVEKVYFYKNAHHERALIAQEARRSAEQYTLQHMLKKFFDNDFCFC